jgi:hypothetical protein
MEKTGKEMSDAVNTLNGVVQSLLSSKDVNAKAPGDGHLSFNDLKTAYEALAVLESIVKNLPQDSASLPYYNKEIQDLFSTITELKKKNQNQS